MRGRPRRGEGENNGMQKREKKNAQTVTGASTRCTLASSTSSSTAAPHRALTAGSGRGSHRRRVSIQASRSRARGGAKEEADVMLRGRGWRAGSVPCLVSRAAPCGLLPPLEGGGAVWYLHVVPARGCVD